MAKTRKKAESDPGHIKTDPRDIPPPEASVLTLRTCQAILVNRWNVDITSVSLRHRRGNKSKGQDLKTWALIKKGASSPRLKIRFETGFGAPGDYWRVAFKDPAGKVWQCKSNFYCDLRSDDEGTVVDCIIKRGSEEMIVSMESGVCTVDVH